MNIEGNTGGVFNPTTIQMFTYTGNNPINLVDPDGKELVRINTTSFNDLQQNIKYQNNPRAQRGIIVDRKAAPTYAAYLSALIKKGYQIRINNSFRTTEEQHNKRIADMATEDISAHEGALALDISVRKGGEGSWQNPDTIKGHARLAKRFGLRSGSNFNKKDHPHVDSGFRTEAVFGYKNREAATRENQADWSNNKDNIPEVQFYIEKTKYETNYQDKAR